MGRKFVKSLILKKAEGGRQMAGDGQLKKDSNFSQLHFSLKREACTGLGGREGKNLLRTVPYPLPSKAEALVNSAQAYQKLAEVLKQQENLEEAAFCYRQAIALNASAAGAKDNTEEPLKLSELVEVSTTDNQITMANFSNLAFASQSVKGNANDQRKTKMISIKNNRSNNNHQASVTEAEAAKVYLEQAQFYCDQKNWDLAIAACEQTLKIAPKMAEAYKIWGNALQRMGQAAEAMGYYAKALEIQPDLAEVHANLGSLYAQKQQWQRAIDYYQKAVAINPKFAGAYRNLAKVWTQVGKSQKATECTYQALTLEPDQAAPEAHFDLGNELWHQGRFSEAIACYCRAIEFNPHLAEACQKLADALAQKGKWKESRTYYRKVSDLSAAGTGTGDRAQKRLKDKQGDRGAGEQRLLNPSAQKSKQLMAVPERALVPSQSKKTTGCNARQASGKSLDAQGKVEQAIQRYIKIAKSQPDSAEVHANLGSLYAQQQQWQQAIACYKKAIELNPKFPGAYRNLAKVLTRTGKRELAVQCWDRALALEPSWAKAEEHLNLGNTLLEQGKTEKALNCYRRAIRLKPSSSQAYHRLGEVLTEQGKVQEAIAAYQQAIKLNPDFWEAHLKLAESLGQRGQYQEAIACYQQVLKYNPSNSLAYFGLGQIGTVQENWQQAIDCYQKAIALEPNRWEAHYNLAEALSKQERCQETVSTYRRAIELNPDFSWSHNSLGDALLKLQRWEEAANAFRKAIELKPDFVWSHYNLGEALAKLGDWEGVVIAYSHAHKLKSDLPSITHKLADARSKRAQSDLEQTASWYQEAILSDPDDLQNYYRLIETQPNNPELYLKLGDLLLKQNQQEQAIAFYKIALQIKPNNPEIAQKLKRLKS